MITPLVAQIDLQEPTQKLQKQCRVNLVYKQSKG